MSSTLNYANTVHIGSGATTAAVGTKLRELAKGQMGLFDSTTLLALDVAGAQALSPKAEVFIATGLGNGEFRKSLKITGDGVERYAGTAYTAPVQLNLQVGKDGATYSLPVNAETEYQLNIRINDDQRIHGQKETVERYHYTTSLSPTSSEVVLAMLSLFGQDEANGSFKKYGNRWVTMGAVSDVSGAALLQDASFEFGSKTVFFAGAPGVVAGDYLKVTAVDSNGTSKAYNYLIVSVDAVNNIVVLDTPYALSTGTVLAANLETYDQATADAANYAFDIVALVPSEDWNQIDTYEVVSFDASYFEAKNPGLDGKEAVVSTLAALNPGAGTGYQVYDLEYFAQGYVGVNSRINYYDVLKFNKAYTDVTADYGIVSIQHTLKDRSDFNMPYPNPLSTQLCIVDGSDQATNFVAILNGFFEDVLGFAAITL